MMTLGYVIVSILLAGTVVLALGILLGLWGAVAAARPELVERQRPTTTDDIPVSRPDE